VLVALVACLLASAQTAHGDFLFGEPEKVPNINSPHCDGTPAISPDGLELYFVSARPPGGRPCGYNLWVSRRETTKEPWSEPMMMDPPIDPMGSCGSPCISASGLEFYFSDGNVQATGCAPRPGGYGGGDLWVTTRATWDDSWSDPVNLGAGVNTEYNEDYPSVSGDGLSLYFVSYRPGGRGQADIYVAYRNAIGQPWGQPVNLGAPINTSLWEMSPFISPDGLSLFFTKGNYTTDIYVSRRATTEDPWGSVTLFEPTYFSGVCEYDTFFAIGDSHVYFSRGADVYLSELPDPWALTTYDILQVEVTPIADFNRDGEIDGQDVLILAERWSEHDALCDIGPPPLGDGIVDLQDLLVLAEHIGEEVYDPTFVAHWALDETEGMTANDSVGTNHGVTAGMPAWRPEGGRIDGAIELDGIDDLIFTPLSLNPADTSFSAFAWIKGGAPGQVVLSQTEGVEWLLTDAEGQLMTALRRAAQTPMLASAFVITDGDWHHVAVTWDGSRRRLYADGTEVAADASDISYLRPSTGRLWIGAGTALEPASYFAGLIDDVRIYTRAVRP
jgi:hypothetical protein